MADLAKLTPPKDLSEHDRQTLFEHFFRRLAAYRHACELYARVEEFHHSSEAAATGDEATVAREDFMREIDTWAQALLENTWIACQEPGGGKCPKLDPLSDTSIGHLPPLPPVDQLSQTLNAILFLHITSSKHYSARTRAFLASFSPDCPPDEFAIAATLKDPDAAVKNAEEHVDSAKEQQAEKGKMLRRVGMGLGAVAGGVLVGVTGGLAAPIVGGAVTALFGALGVGGTAVGLLASGLASSGVVCGALFGAYGARTTANMVERHTREVRDLKVVQVREFKETLSLRLCVSGWLHDRDDVTAPWTVFEGDDTYALQWEVQALEDLSNAMYSMVKSQAMKYVKAEIIRRTIFAALMTSLAPIALLKVGKIIDNPWMNARALALKTGAVLATLIYSRAFGNRPLTLTGYSLGSLVIFEALRILSEDTKTYPPSQTAHLISDVFLFGTPVSANPRTWSSVRRLVSGRLVNGYSSEDYILAVLSRAADASWAVAGLGKVEVQGVENVEFKNVEGHLKWRGCVGSCLVDVGARGVNKDEAERQETEVGDELGKEMQMDDEEIEKTLQTGMGEADDEDEKADNARAGESA